jgi:hypothetical protein
MYAQRHIDAFFSADECKPTIAHSSDRLFALILTSVFSIFLQSSITKCGAMNFKPGCWPGTAIPFRN